MLKINEPIALADIFIFNLRHLTTAVDNSEILPKMKILKRAAGQFFSKNLIFFCAHRNQRVKWQLLSNTPLASKTKMQNRTTLVCSGWPAL